MCQKKLLPLLLLLAGLLLSSCSVLRTGKPHYNPFESPKREFRGAWIQCINGQFDGMSREQMQSNLRHQLNQLKAVNVNTIIFQVRPEADALYDSPFEPWSRFLSGTQGKNPGWDPLAWMVDECHARGMELHAWINPFRAKLAGTTKLAATHPYLQHPERFVKYGSLYIFDPGLPENQRYICQVAADIVRRYDIDGLHIDDYFYPYPEAGRVFNDDATFRAYANGISNRADWRRYNVNNFVKMLWNTVHSEKPWVKFGISPFGIYHNNNSASPASTANLPGSDTKGLQNYDDLYADVLYWVNQGWVDYTVPQVYWEIGHKSADYDRLVKFWARYASARPLVIGQDVERSVRAKDVENPTVNQVASKFEIQRNTPGVVGSCLWYSAAVVRNEGNFATDLQNNYHLTPALQPLMPFIDSKAPRKPRKLCDVWTAEGYYLFWTPPTARHEMDKARLYAIYCFQEGEAIDLNSSTHLIATTPDTFYKLPYNNGKSKFTYVVTSLDRLQNESKGVVCRVRL